MSHFQEGPIASYNSLHDGHLNSYFGNMRIRRHLVKAGLITKDGRLVSEEEYRVQLARREHKRMMKDMISQAIVHRTIEVERQRQAEIKKKLEEIAKLELVKRVRASRSRRGDEEVLQYLLPLPSKDDSKLKGSSGKMHKNRGILEEEEDYHTTSDTVKDDIYVRNRNFDSFAHLRRRNTKSAYPKERIEMAHWTNLDRKAVEEYHDQTKDIDALPALAPFNHPQNSRGYQRAASSKRREPKTISFSRATSLHRPGSLVVLHEAKYKSLCEVSMMFLGLGFVNGPSSSLHDVSIDQQHCGGNTLTVFKGKLSEGDVFTFVSRRHLNFPFSLTVYVDGKVDCRLSTCCEYKHRCGKILGGSTGHFRLQEVRGGAPCYKCQTEHRHVDRTSIHGHGNYAKQDSSSSESEEKGKTTTVVSASAKSGTKGQQKKKMLRKIRKTVTVAEPQPHLKGSYDMVSTSQEAVVRLHEEDHRNTGKQYDNEKFDSDDEPDKASVVLTPTSEPPTPVSSNKAQAAQSETYSSIRQASATASSNHTAVAAFLQTETKQSRLEGIKAESSTVIVKLPNGLGADSPSSSRHQHLYSEPNSPSPSPRVTTTAVATTHENLQSEQPSVRDVQIVSPATAETSTPVETLSSPTQPNPSRSATNLKKSVSFNDVRFERQISDEENYSPDEADHRQQQQAINVPINVPPATSQDDDDDEDPNAVANHEAALALEAQQKAAEDKTPFLQPESTVLDINKQTLSDRQVRRLCAEILNTTMLQKIVIRESGLNDGMVQRICDALQHSQNHIRLLCLNLNAISAAGIVHVVELLHAKPTIKMLLLYGNPLGDNGLNTLVDGMFGDLPEELISDLSAQGIEIPSLSEDAPVRIGLTHLDLGEIGISSAGAIKLSKLLDKLPTLRVLNLGGNHNVGLEGWSAISKSLSDKSYPLKLCLSHCRLGNKCTTELATALRTNVGVEHVDLEGCGIGEEGGRALLELVDSEPKKLENIVLTENRIPDRLMKFIEDGLRRLRGESDEDD